MSCLLGSFGGHRRQSVVAAHGADQRRERRLLRLLALLEPPRQQRIWKRKQPLEIVKLLGRHAAKPRVSKTPEHQIHLLSAAMTGTISRAATPYLDVIGHRRTGLS